MKISEILNEKVNLWKGKNVVAQVAGLYIAVDDPKDATYVTVWSPNNNKVGSLSTRKISIEPDYLSIGLASLNDKYRNKGVGYAMYLALLNHLGSHYKGISSYLADRSNHRQVPKIWEKLGGIVSQESDDVIIANKNK